MRGCVRLIYAWLLAVVTSAWFFGATVAHASQLFFTSESETDLLRISTAATDKVRVARVGSIGLTATTADQTAVYWATEPKDVRRSASFSGATIVRASLSGTHVKRLVGGLSDVNGMTIAGGYLYWIDEHAIGRVALDGSRVNRRFIALKRERVGDVGEGLASEGGFLYFTRCSDGAIGRVGLDGTGVEYGFVQLGRGACPQGLAVTETNIYWGQLELDGDGYVGRATLQGLAVDDRWLDVGTIGGPYDLAADGNHVYWAADYGHGANSYIARARTDGSHMVTRFVAGSGPIALLTSRRSSALPPASESPGSNDREHGGQERCSARAAVMTARRRRAKRARRPAR